MRLWIWIKEHWLAAIGATGWLPSIWAAIKWALQKLLETGEHIEFFANRWHDLPETRQMIENWPALPPWIGLPVLLIGLALIYFDLHRTKISREPVPIQKSGKIEICFKSCAPYEVSDISHGHVLSAVRIGVKNSGGSPLSNCKVYIESVSPPPVHVGLFPAKLDSGAFVLRNDEPEKLIDVAVHWDHLKQYRFSTPVGGFISAVTLNYMNESEQRSFVIEVVATECTKSAVFKILVDEIKKLRLQYIGEAN
jgi:hypothetical protein